MEPNNSKQNFVFQDSYISYPKKFYKNSHNWKIPQSFNLPACVECTPSVTEQRNQIKNFHSSNSYITKLPSSTNLNSYQPYNNKNNSQTAVKENISNYDNQNMPPDNSKAAVSTSATKQNSSFLTQQVAKKQILKNETTRNLQPVHAREQQLTNQFVSSVQAFQSRKENNNLHSTSSNYGINGNPQNMSSNRFYQPHINYSSSGLQRPPRQPRPVPQCPRPPFPPIFPPPRPPLMCLQGQGQYSARQVLRNPDTRYHDLRRYDINHQNYTNLYPYHTANKQTRLNYPIGNYISRINNNPHMKQNFKSGQNHRNQRYSNYIREYDKQPLQTFNNYSANQQIPTVVNKDTIALSSSENPLSFNKTESDLQSSRSLSFKEKYKHTTSNNIKWCQKTQFVSPETKSVNYSDSLNLRQMPKHLQANSKNNNTNLYSPNTKYTILKRDTKLVSKECKLQEKNSKLSESMKLKSPDIKMSESLYPKKEKWSFNTSVASDINESRSCHSTPKEVNIVSPKNLLSRNNTPSPRSAMSNSTLNKYITLAARSHSSTPTLFSDEFDLKCISETNISVVQDKLQKFRLAQLESRRISPSVLNPPSQTNSGNKSKKSDNNQSMLASGRSRPMLKTIKCSRELFDNTSLHKEASEIDLNPSKIISQSISKFDLISKDGKEFNDDLGVTKLDLTSCGEISNHVQKADSEKKGIGKVLDVDMSMDINKEDVCIVSILSDKDIPKFNLSDSDDPFGDVLMLSGSLASDEELNYADDDFDDIIRENMTNSVDESDDKKVNSKGDEYDKIEHNIDDDAEDSDDASSTSSSSSLTLYEDFEKIQEEARNSILSRKTISMGSTISPKKTRFHVRSHTYPFSASVKRPYNDSIETDIEVNGKRQRTKSLPEKEVLITPCKILIEDIGNDYKKQMTNKIGNIEDRHPVAQGVSKPGPKCSKMKHKFGTCYFDSVSSKMVPVKLKQQRQTNPREAERDATKTDYNNKNPNTKYVSNTSPEKICRKEISAAYALKIKEKKHAGLDEKLPMQKYPDSQLKPSKITACNKHGRQSRMSTPSKSQLSGTKETKSPASKRAKLTSHIDNPDKSKLATTKKLPSVSNLGNKYEKTRSSPRKCFDSKGHSQTSSSESTSKSKNDVAFRKIKKQGIHAIELGKIRSSPRKCFDSKGYSQTPCSISKRTSQSEHDGAVEMKKSKQRIHAIDKRKNHHKTKFTFNTSNNKKLESTPKKLVNFTAKTKEKTTDNLYSVTPPSFPDKPQKFKNSDLVKLKKLKNKHSKPNNEDQLLFKSSKKGENMSKNAGKTKPCDKQKIVKPCPYCQNEFPTMELLRFHLTTHKNKCNKCHITFPTSKEAFVHRRTHYKQFFHCKICQRDFSQKARLEGHQKSSTHRQLVRVQKQILECVLSKVTSSSGVTDSLDLSQFADLIKFPTVISTTIDDVTEKVEIKPTENIEITSAITTYYFENEEVQNLLHKVEQSLIDGSVKKAEIVLPESSGQESTAKVASVLPIMSSTYVVSSATSPLDSVNVPGMNLQVTSYANCGVSTARPNESLSEIKSESRPSSCMYPTSAQTTSDTAQFCNLQTLNQVASQQAIYNSQSTQPVTFDLLDYTLTDYSIVKTEQSYENTLTEFLSTNKNLSSCEVPDDFEEFWNCDNAVFECDSIPTFGFLSNSISGSSSGFQGSLLNSQSTQMQFPSSTTNNFPSRFSATSAVSIMDISNSTVFKNCTLKNRTREQANILSSEMVTDVFSTQNYSTPIMSPLSKTINRLIPPVAVTGTQESSHLLNTLGNSDSCNLPNNDKLSMTTDILNGNSGNTPDTDKPLVNNNTSSNVAKNDKPEICLSKSPTNGVFSDRNDSLTSCKPATSAVSTSDVLDPETNHCETNIPLVASLGVNNVVDLVIQEPCNIKSIVSDMKPTKILNNDECLSNTTMPLLDKTVVNKELCQSNVNVNRSSLVTENINCSPVEQVLIETSNMSTGDTDNQPRISAAGEVNWQNELPVNQVMMVISEIPAKDRNKETQISVATESNWKTDAGLPVDVLDTPNSSVLLLKNSISDRRQSSQHVAEVLKSLGKSEKSKNLSTNSGMEKDNNVQQVKDTQHQAYDGNRSADDYNDLLPLNVSRISDQDFSFTSLMESFLPLSPSSSFTKIIEKIPTEKSRNEIPLVSYTCSSEKGEILTQPASDRTGITVNSVSVKEVSISSKPCSNTATSSEIFQQISTTSMEKSAVKQGASPVRTSLNKCNTCPPFLEDKSADNIFDFKKANVFPVPQVDKNFVTENILNHSEKDYVPLLIKPDTQTENSSFTSLIESVLPVSPSSSFPKIIEKMSNEESINEKSLVSDSSKTDESDCQEIILTTDNSVSVKESFTNDKSCSSTVTPTFIPKQVCNDLRTYDQSIMSMEKFSVEQDASVAMESLNNSSSLPQILEVMSATKFFDQVDKNFTKGNISNTNPVTEHYSLLVKPDTQAEDSSFTTLIEEVLPLSPSSSFVKKIEKIPTEKSVNKIPLVSYTCSSEKGESLTQPASEETDNSVLVKETTSCATFQQVSYNLSIMSMEKSSDEQDASLAKLEVVLPLSPTSSFTKTVEKKPDEKSIMEISLVSDSSKKEELLTQSAPEKTIITTDNCLKEVSNNITTMSMENSVCEQDAFVAMESLNNSSSLPQVLRDKSADKVSNAEKTQIEENLNDNDPETESNFLLIKPKTPTEDSAFTSLVKSCLPLSPSSLIIKTFEKMPNENSVIEISQASNSFKNEELLKQSAPEEASITTDNSIKQFSNNLTTMSMENSVCEQDASVAMESLNNSISLPHILGDKPANKVPGAEKTQIDENFTKGNNLNNNNPETESNSLLIKPVTQMEDCSFTSLMKSYLPLSPSPSFITTIEKKPNEKSIIQISLASDSSKKEELLTQSVSKETILTRDNTVSVKEVSISDNSSSSTATPAVIRKEVSNDLTTMSMRKSAIEKDASVTIESLHKTSFVPQILGVFSADKVSVPENTLIDKNFTICNISNNPEKCSFSSPIKPETQTINSLEEGLIPPESSTLSYTCLCDNDVGPEPDVPIIISSDLNTPDKV